MRRLLSALLVACILLAFPSCGQQKNEAADKTIQYYIDQEPQTLDPQVASDSSAILTIGALYEGLARLDSDGKAAPGVAESWSANDAGTAFTFHLRENAVWSDGQPVTASDFVFAFRRALAPQTKSAACRPLYVVKNARKISDGSLPAEQLGVRAENDKTLVVELEYAYADFPALTAETVFMPCNEKFFQQTQGKYGLEYKSILSNGPFVLGGKYSWDHGKQIKLTRSDTYKGEQPALPATLIFAMLGSDVDVSDPIKALTASNVDAIALPEQQVAEAQKLGLPLTSFQDITWGLAFNTQDSLMQNEKIRQGLTAALPRQKLLNHLPEKAEQAEYIIGPQAMLMGENYRKQAGTAVGYLKESTQSGALVQAGLKELGHPEFSHVTVLCPDIEQAKLMVNEMLVSWNRLTGQYFSMQPMAESELQKAVDSGDYQIALTGIYPERDGKLLSVFRSDSPQNPSRLASPDFDRLLLTAEQSGSAAALSSYLQAENYLSAHAVFYPIYYKNSYYACAKGVTGIVFRPNSAGIDFLLAGKTD
ncbi:peptide ABC transporter substrate-binding protein [Faecalispora anaeroviscerum]|uniref:peptide ABC transporter substrate-binding protein n=1 Tax=Faecalispora anaeroviscerum TaxID=2991836 RepID=UPI0024BA9E99|nr:peptide ABC transporter substrate-binding protein [Faecalispora anaeroviscerum]